MPQASKAKVLLSGVLLILLSTRYEAQNSITGRWVWSGNRGWQRIILDLNANGGRLTGSITLGPGSKAESAEDWEYFFEPAVFPIANGTVNGNTFAFEQVLSNGLMPSPAGGFVTVTREGNSRTIPERARYTGQLENNSIVITREIPERLNDPFSLGSHRVRFIASREGSGATLSSQAEVTPGPIQASAPSVSLDVEVLDGAGAPALSLTKDDFVIREDGAVRPILNLIPPSAPQNVLLMFDHNLTWLKDDSRSDRTNVSGSWERLFQSSLSFIGRLRTQDRVSMGVFEDSSKVVLDWRGPGAGSVRAYIGDVMKPPTGQKDMYGMLRSALGQFENMNGRKSVVIFTDGRDGRLSPRWFRDPRGHEVLDPLFGLFDAGEAEDFASLLKGVEQSGVKLHFIVINSDQDPEFGPAVVGRRISGLYPNSSEGIRDYLARVRSRLKQLAEISGGRVLYGNTAQDALTLYRDLHLELGIGKLYTLEFRSEKPTDGSFHNLEASVANKGYRLTQYRTGYTAQ